MSVQKLLLCVQTVYLFCYLTALHVTLRIVHFISPSLAKKIILKMGEKTTMSQNPNFRYEDWGLTFMSMEFFRTAYTHIWLSLRQEAFTGAQAPDSPLVTMDGERTSVHAFLKGSRPLVLSFGSCT